MEILDLISRVYFMSVSIDIYILPPIQNSARDRLSNAGLLHPSI